MKNEDAAAVWNRNGGDDMDEEKDMKGAGKRDGKDRGKNDKTTAGAPETVSEK